MTDRYVMRIVGLAATGLPPTGHEGRYLESYDLDARDGRGELTTTDNPDRALTYSCPAAALAAWQQQSTSKPYRPDLMANRPLTAFTVHVLTVDDARAGR